jgi:hypothetical protein
MKVILPLDELDTPDPNNFSIRATDSDSETDSFFLSLAYAT